MRDLYIAKTKAKMRRKMNMEQPNASWNLCLAPAKKNSKAELEEELEMREGMGLKLGAESPCLEFGGGIGTGAA